jgi:hypothetical protein
VFKLPSITHQSVSPHSLWLSNSAACQVPINCRRCGARRLGTLGGNIGRAGAVWFSRCDGPPAAGAASCCPVFAPVENRGRFDADSSPAANVFTLRFGTSGSGPRATLEMRLAPVCGHDNIGTAEKLSMAHVKAHRAVTCKTRVMVNRHGGAGRSNPIMKEVVHFLIARMTVISPTLPGTGGCTSQLGKRRSIVIRTLTA